MNNSIPYKIHLAEYEPQNVGLLIEALNPGIYATGKMTHVENLRTALETDANDFISKNNDSLLKDLQSLEMMVDKEGPFVLKKRTSGIMSSTSVLNWEEFATQFEKVHPSFFRNLRIRFPDLTSSESELCAFIKLNMTNKEILAVTHKNDNTLKKSCQRLKKALDLTNDDSLYNFIREFE